MFWVQGRDFYLLIFGATSGCGSMHSRDCFLPHLWIGGHLCGQFIYYSQNSSRVQEPMSERQSDQDGPWPASLLSAQLASLGQL